MRRLDVMANSRPSYLQLAGADGPIVAWRQWGRRDNILVLETEIYPAPSYLVS